MKRIELTPHGLNETTVFIGEIEELASKLDVFYKSLFKNPQVVQVDGEIIVDVVITDVLDPQNTKEIELVIVNTKLRGRRK